VLAVRRDRIVVSEARQTDGLQAPSGLGGAARAAAASRRGFVSCNLVCSILCEGYKVTSVGGAARGVRDGWVDGRVSGTSRSGIFIGLAPPGWAGARSGCLGRDGSIVAAPAGGRSWTGP
jgi:hypothetical protein